MPVNYGREIKAFLLSKVNLLRIHQFNPLKIQFSDALVTSTVVFYSTGQTSDGVLFTDGNDINKPDSQKFILSKDLNPNDKWSDCFLGAAKKKNIVAIGDYFFVKRGIATGSNKHFIFGGDLQSMIDRV